MTTRVTVTLRCDVAQAPDCHRESSAAGRATPATMLRGTKDAQDAGGRTDGTPVGERDRCPACVAVGALERSASVHQRRRSWPAAPRPAPSQEETGHAYDD